MVVSSRTPEGSPNHCPLCQSNIQIEPSLFFGDAPCPNCGTLLWFIQLSPEHVYWFEKEPQELKDRIINRIAKLLGVPPETLEDGKIRLNELDSISTVELVMELEEEFR